MENKLGGGFGVIIQLCIKNISLFISFYLKRYVGLKNKKNDFD